MTLHINAPDFSGCSNHCMAFKSLQLAACTSSLHWQSEKAVTTAAAAAGTAIQRLCLLF